MDQELVNIPVSGPSRVKGLQDSIDPNKPPLNYRDGGRIGPGRNGRRRMIKNIKASLNKEQSKLLDQRKVLKC
jgi:hypothetical protein